MILLQFAVLPLTLSFAGTIPFVVDRDSDIPIVSITTGSLPSSPHKLYIGNRIIKHVSDHVPEDKLREHVEIFDGESYFDGSGVSPLVFKRLEFEVSSDELSQGDWLALGPLSELVVAHESVDYFSAPSELVLGSPEESFVALCVSESVARVPVAAKTRYHGDKAAILDVFAFGAIQTATSELQVTLAFSPIDVVFEISVETFGEFFADEISQDLVEFSDRPSISTVDALDQFQNITVVFFNQESKVAGSITLSPIDYIDVNTGIFRIRWCDDTDEPILRFNPFLIPDINVRSTNFGLMIGRSI